MRHDDPARRFGRAGQCFAQRIQGLAQVTNAGGIQRRNRLFNHRHPRTAGQGRRHPQFAQRAGGQVPQRFEQMRLQAKAFAMRLPGFIAPLRPALGHALCPLVGSNLTRLQRLARVVPKHLRLKSGRLKLAVQPCTYHLPLAGCGIAGQHRQPACGVVARLIQQRMHTGGQLLCPAMAAPGSAAGPQICPRHQRGRRRLRCM